MPKLKVIYERLAKLNNGKTQQQEIELTTAYPVNSINDIDDIPYNDFQAMLYIDHKFIADISPVLSNMGVFKDLVDNTEWENIYREMTEKEFKNL